MRFGFIAFTVVLAWSACVATVARSQTIPAEGGKGTPVFRNISIAEADKLIQADKSIVALDVRTPDEFSAGRLPGAINVDFYEKDFAPRLAKLDRSKTYLLYCKAGGRSAKTESMMKSLGFKSVLHLKDGFDKWEAAGKAVQK